MNSIKYHFGASFTTSFDPQFCNERTTPQKRTTRAQLGLVEGEMFTSVTIAGEMEPPPYLSKKDVDAAALAAQTMTAAIGGMTRFTSLFLLLEVFFAFRCRTILKGRP